MIVDDKATSFLRYYRNGIQIKEWNGGEDEELPKLSEYLMGFAKDFDLNKLKHDWGY